MKHVVSTMIAVAALFLCVAPAQAQKGGPGMGGPGVGGPGMGGPGMGGPGMGKMFRPEMIDMLASELGVADNVVKQIKDKAYKADQEAIKLRADLDSGRLEMRRLMDEDKPDVAKVMKQVETVGAVETELKKNRIRLLLSVRELLTPEQRKKLQKHMAERMGPRGDMDDDGPGMGPGRHRGPGGHE
jgi:Spy/CpxP family protein refolding chaperone